MNHAIKILFTLCVVSLRIVSQNKEIENVIEGELKMTFPSIYFKHGSTDYAIMPYTADSCFKYIAIHFEDNINSLVIWRDSTETEQLTNKRIEKLKTGIKKHLSSKDVTIHSMDEEQKISRRTIYSTSDSARIQYLFSLNSVFDISKTQFPVEKKSTKRSHVDHPRIWCPKCWKNHRFSKEYRQLHVKKKKRRHLVWTGWKTGFHWSTAK
jgi:hypothetical protein